MKIKNRIEWNLLIVKKSSEDKPASTESLLNGAIFARKSLSSSSENVQSMIIKVLDDIVVRVSESENSEQLNNKNLNKKAEKKSNRKRSKNVKKNQQQQKKNADNNETKIEIEEKKENEMTKRNVSKIELKSKSALLVDELKEVKNDLEQKEGMISDNQKNINKTIKAESISIQLTEQLSEDKQDQYMDDEQLNRKTISPEQYDCLLDCYRDPSYWQQSAIIETEHNNISVCEKLIVQSMPNISYPNRSKLSQQVNSGLSILHSRSPSQVNISEVEKQRAFSDYGHCNELLCKIHARSRIARQLRKKSRRGSKQFTLPSGYKVAYSSTNAQRSFKFNKTKHHYQPPVQFQRSLSCSVAVLNSLSLPAKKHRKRRRDSSESSAAKKSLHGSTKRPKLNYRQVFTLIVLATLAFASQCSMSIIAPYFPLESSKKGVSESISGLVFSVHAFTVMVCSPLIGK